MKVVLNIARKMEKQALCKERTDVTQQDAKDRAGCESVT